jgi:hypothetical protein
MAVLSLAAQSLQVKKQARSNRSLFFARCKLNSARQAQALVQYHCRILADLVQYTYFIAK